MDRRDKERLRNLRVGDELIKTTTYTKLPNRIKEIINYKLIKSEEIKENKPTIYSFIVEDIKPKLKREEWIIIQ